MAHIFSNCSEIRETLGYFNFLMSNAEKRSVDPDEDLRCGAKLRQFSISDICTTRLQMFTLI